MHSWNPGACHQFNNGLAGCPHLDVGFSLLLLDFRIWISMIRDGCWSVGAKPVMSGCMCGHTKATIVACGLDLQCTGSYACATWNKQCMNICVADRVVATWLKLHGTGTRRCTTSGAIAYRNAITCSTLIFLQLPLHLAWPSRLYIG